MLSVVWLLLLSLCSCADEENSDVTIEPAPSEPLAILAKSQISFTAGIDVITVDLNPPWSPLKFTFENDSNDTVTIVAMSFLVTDPVQGENNLILVVNFSVTESVVLTTIRANGDLNCDGFVNEDDNAVTNPIPIGDTENCPLDASNLTFSPKALYIESIVSNVGGGGGENNNATVAEQYRGLSFPVIGRFEGWYGTPDQPLRNFYQEVFFNLKAN